MRAPFEWVMFCCAVERSEKHFDNLVKLEVLSRVAPPGLHQSDAREALQKKLEDLVIT